MGAKNPLVVLDDAELQLAVEIAASGSYFQTGQRCTASSRLIVTSGIYGKFLDALTNRIKQLTVDDACKHGTDVGPVVDANQLKKDEDYIRIGKGEGATLVWGASGLIAYARLLPATGTVCRDDASHAYQSRGDLWAGGQTTTRRWPLRTTRRSVCRQGYAPPA